MGTWPRCEIKSSFNLLPLLISIQLDLSPSISRGLWPPMVVETFPKATEGTTITQLAVNNARAEVISSGTLDPQLPAWSRRCVGPWLERKCQSHCRAEQDGAGDAGPRRQAGGRRQQPLSASEKCVSPSIVSDSLRAHKLSSAVNGLLQPRGAWPGPGHSTTWGRGLQATTWCPGGASAESLQRPRRRFRSQVP